MLINHIFDEIAHRLLIKTCNISNSRFWLDSKIKRIKISEIKFKNIVVNSKSIIVFSLFDQYLVEWHQWDKVLWERSLGIESQAYHIPVGKSSKFLYFCWSIVHFMPYHGFSIEFKPELCTGQSKAGMCSL